jgi:hypothetical protein
MKIGSLYATTYVIQKKTVGTHKHIHKMYNFIYMQKEVFVIRLKFHYVD